MLLKIQIVLGDHDKQDANDEDKFITCKTQNNQEVVGFEYNEIEEDKRKYLINETFSEEAYFKICSKSKITNNE